MFAPELVSDAARLLDLCRARGLMLASAESCTGGLVSGLLTEVAGSSDVFDRGFITYSNAAKRDLLGVPESVLASHGAVSAPTAGAMVSGALARSSAHLAVSVTGIAGPGGGSLHKPVGLVYIAAGWRGEAPEVEEHRFGDRGRAAIREAAVRCAIEMLHQLARSRD